MTTPAEQQFPTRIPTEHLAPFLRWTLEQRDPEDDDAADRATQRLIAAIAYALEGDPSDELALAAVDCMEIDSLNHPNTARLYASWAITRLQAMR